MAWTFLCHIQNGNWCETSVAVFVDSVGVDFGGGTVATSRFNMIVSMSEMFVKVTNKESVCVCLSCKEISTKCRWVTMTKWCWFPYRIFKSKVTIYRESLCACEWEWINSLLKNESQCNVCMYFDMVCYTHNILFKKHADMYPKMYDDDFVKKFSVKIKMKMKWRLALLSLPPWFTI